MHSYTLTQTLHPVFNELDRHGLLLDLKRIRGESNESYKKRLLDVMVHPASSTYTGLINGISRELGLDITAYIEVEFDAVDGLLVDPAPALVFHETKCVYYDDVSVMHEKGSFDRFNPSGGVSTIGELKTALEALGGIAVTLLQDASTRTMCIMNGSTIGSINSETFNSVDHTIQLAHKNLVEGSVSILSRRLTRRMPSIAAVTRSGDYFINVRDGIIRTFSTPGDLDKIRYQYCEADKKMKGSQVIIHDNQSDDFQEQMFEQDVDSNGDPVHGLPTALGADIINELLTVTPVSWGK